MSDLSLRYLGHSCVELILGEERIVIDPFLSGNPMAPVTPEDVEPTVICVTHGHADHVGDTVAIAQRTGAPVVAITELAHELADTGIETHDPNLGGTVAFPWGSVKLVPAWHTSMTSRGTACTPAGLLIDIGGRRIYHLGDTALFGDLRLIAGERGVDLALVPIGGHYTTDRHDAVAAVKLIRPGLVVPVHFDTFPVVLADADAFCAEVDDQTAARAVRLRPGTSMDIPGAPAPHAGWNLVGRMGWDRRR